MTAEQIIKFFKMQPLRQEGGFYVETYRCAERIKKAALPGRFSGERNLGSVILYLLTAKTISLLHRLKSDEIFHFYFGHPVTMLQLHPDGKSEIITLGHNILKEQKVQVLVGAGVWQGAFVQPGGKFSLLGCSVAPGFEEEDFELGNRNDLLDKYPDLREMILKLTRGQ
jgi:predicted cupin superfamily sugar epimerase